ncbi:hypothetical protein OEZ85_009637 [Tetradesmus obliquus]|uniref:Uncharacterized protein n=1 Tax=Tetradesmus obliquus TaxID=3088 RepID=A0ABY8UA62_TETOB|nr:hypothetical protein OEZ85_009637 [Tetradesmus obliquus]
MDPGLMLTLAPELRPFRPQVEAYANAKIQRFAYMFANRLNLNITKEQIDYVTAETMHNMAAMQEPIQMMPQQNLRLVLRHDCLSSGCGDNGCSLCQYNPSRICKRNLKQKYLIDDHLRAKCGAGLRVEVVDENGQCVSEPVPDMELEVHMLNGEKYKEVCPDNTLLNNAQLRGCIIQPNHKKPLLKRESAMGVAEDTRIFLTVEHGQAPLSDLQCTTSSEALLCGKAPTFRLLVWAIDRASGTPVPNVTYVVSESFVVATKRVKHAIKSDIPSIGDHISKLVHIGKATVDKLQDIRQAAVEENLDLELPEELNRVDKVGQFRQLVEMTEKSSDLKHKLRHLLKLSPEKWEEVSQHALSAVVPDFRPRVWWYPGINGALLFACKNGAVLPEHPVAYVTKDGGSGVEGVTPIQQVDAFLFNLLPKLKQQAMQDWFAPGHTGWAVYWRDPNDPLAQQMQPGPNGPGYMQQLPLGISAAAALGSAGAEQMAAAVGGMAPSAAQMGGPEQSKLAQALPSLEMLNTDDLPPIDRNNSLWPLDSFQQQMQMLAELPSVGVGSMLAEAGVGAGAQGRMGGPGQPGQQMGGANGLDDQPDRALSLKFSMSLDLEEVPKELRSGGSGN